MSDPFYDGLPDDVQNDVENDVENDAENPIVSVVGNNPELPALWEEGVELVPVQLEVVQTCHFKAKVCKTCGLPKSNRVHTPKKTATCPFKRQNGCASCGEPKKYRGHLGAPPSMNMWGRGGDSYVYTNLKEQWEEAFRDLLVEAKLPRGLGGVFAEGEATFPDRNERDQGNFRVLIEKALGDALEAGGWIERDDWSRYEFGNLTRAYRAGESATRIALFPRPPGSSAPAPVDAAQEMLPVDFG